MIDVEELQYSDDYAQFIMNNASDRPIGNGDMLLVAMEDGYLFDEFLKSKGLNPNDY